MITLLCRYGLDILICCILAWFFIVTGKANAKKRVLFLALRLFPLTLAAFFLISIVIPGLFGSISHYARYFPQFREAHKLRVYWHVACLIPRVRGSEANIQQTIDETAREFTMHPDLIRAIVHVESSSNQFALSNVGGCGLMQVMPNTFFSLHRGNPFAVKSNLSAGTKYLRKLYRRFDGNIELALAAYNIGPGVVARIGAVPPGRVSRYVDKVMWWYHHYRNNGRK